MTDKINRFEVFRFITPILISLSLFILGAIWRNVDEMAKSVNTLQIDVAVLKVQVSKNVR